MPSKTTVTMPTKPRISSRIRTVMDLHVRRGRTVAQACEEAGLSVSGWYRAIKRPEVSQLLQETQLAYVAEVEAMRAPFRAMAYEVAADIAVNGKTEAARLKAVEILAGSNKQHTTAVQVNVGQGVGGGYEFVRPGQKVVEITNGTAEVASSVEDN